MKTDNLSYMKVETAPIREFRTKNLQNEHERQRKRLTCYTTQAGLNNPNGREQHGLESRTTEQQAVVGGMLDALQLMLHSFGHMT